MSIATLISIHSTCPPKKFSLLAFTHMIFLSALLQQVRRYCRSILSREVWFFVFLLIFTLLTLRQKRAEKYSDYRTVHRTDTWHKRGKKVLEYSTVHKTDTHVHPWYKYCTLRGTKIVPILHIGVHIKNKLNNFLKWWSSPKMTEVNMTT